ncbi:DEAD/DEAH box helicase [Bacillus aquiflavi]|uniref:DEAD/DEAH box helicase n=1 Tax=Bacillus aquiflavi TaxID=2672567 RepID=UPI001CAA081D|nr:DEAD/DEAH box helicase [Bacillus aquiflavi]UAC48313.1 DEAD/DEAH box helicase [Bacillus aquiflavi]
MMRMSVRLPEHWLIDTLPTDMFVESVKIADLRLISNALANNFIAFSSSSLNEEENEKILGILDTLELVIMDLENVKLKNKEEKSDFYNACELAFILLRALPIPNDEISKIKYFYKLITYAYLGQRWQDGRRFLIENESLWNVEVDDNEWDLRLFKNIYKAFLFLVRKKDWNDLNKVSEIIINLRREQSSFEERYLDNVEIRNKKSRAFELLGIYHLSKAIDLTATFMINGDNRSIREAVDLHLDKSIEISENSANIEMNLIIRLLKSMLNQMIHNSIWMVTPKTDAKISSFVNNITKSAKPLYELLYPQRVAILEQGLLDPAHKAIVVDMPTSSGKTIIAEFRILQALNLFSEQKGWVVYVVPTRALVNQITNRLTKDLSQIGIKVAKVSGSLDTDLFEENLLNSSETDFDILVTTAEKLNLLIRNNIEKNINRPLTLAVIDEAHNLEDEYRGINYEILLANLKQDCPNANLLLLTPFIPNSDAIAEWLDPDSPASIGIGLSWQPNDRLIGAIYPEGRARTWKTKFHTLVTERERIKYEGILNVSNTTPIDETRSNLTKTKIAMSFAKQMYGRKGVLIIAQSPQNCWDLADQLSSYLPDIEIDDEIILIKKYIEAELGENFALIKLLNKGIGVHHAGLPDDIRLLMEMLMEDRKINFLVATTTIAQGINFPISTVIMASLYYPYGTKMPTKDFWNIVGRAGRADQGTLGLVGIVIGDQERSKQVELDSLIQYLKQSTNDLVSNLLEMVEDLKMLGNGDLGTLIYRDARWSQFLQYLAHMYNQSQNLGDFNTNAEIFLRRTFGFKSLDTNSQRILVNKVKEYAVKLNNAKASSTLSDSTGFSPEAINRTIGALSTLGLQQNVWDRSRLFKSGSELKDLMGIMLNIPEIKDSLKEVTSRSSVTGKYLADVISDWVEGKTLNEIANKYFGQDDSDSLTKCCRAIYSKIVNAASWGLSSMLKMPANGIDYENLTHEDVKKIKNLPSMIYYGVNTSEAVLMRSVNIPRSIANELGVLFANENNIDTASTTKAMKWLNDLNLENWNKASSSNKLSGEEYKKVWAKLNGLD